MARSNDLEELYLYLKWPMAPEDPEARERFEGLVKFFRESLRDLEDRSRVRVLDLMAGTGIAGVAASKALTEMGKEVELVISDVRRKDLQLVEGWLSYANLKLRYESLQADVEDAVRRVKGKFDLILIWGSSMPHLSPWKAAKVLAGLREVSSGEAKVMVEQWDISGSLLRRNQFKRILLEGKVDDEGQGLLSLHVGYDPFTGMDERAYYRLPGMKFLLKTRVHLWGLSELATMMWLFYEEVDLIERWGRWGRPVVVARRPRKVAVPYDDLRYPKSI